MEQSTAQDVLNLLKTSPPLTVAEISQTLNLTKADIRYHITRLTHNGHIRSLTPPPKHMKSRAGRPSKVFTVSDQVFPDNIHELMQTWFILSGLDSDTIKTAAQLLAKNFSVKRKSEPSIFQTINNVIVGLNQRHYSARWEIKPSGPVLYFHNCPYRSLASKNPQLCDLDAHLLTLLTGLRVIPQQTIVKNSQSRCTFSLSTS